MKIADLVSRSDIWVNFAAGRKIPWDDPDFSRRMLKNHLAQEHEWASRPIKIIRRQTDWIASLLPNTDARILDLGCGPGLYTHLLAQAGYECLGVDFSPASIAYAREQAQGRGLKLGYELADVRTYQPQGTFDLVMMVFGELNVFSQEEAVELLWKAGCCLNHGGKLLLEMQSADYVYQQSEEPLTWEACSDGLFADEPYLMLCESAWDENNTRTATHWYIIKDAGKIEEYYACTQAYDQRELRKLLVDGGFAQITKVDPQYWPTGETFGEGLEAFLCFK